MNYIILFRYLMPKSSKCIGALHGSSGSSKSAHAANSARRSAASSAKLAISHPFRTNHGADLQICRL